MKVKGIEISEEQIAAMLKVMGGKRWRASDITVAAEAAGVTPGGVAMRAADRLIQQQRKARKIKIIDSGPYWTSNA